MNSLKEDFEAFLKKDFPTAYKSKEETSVKMWVDFAFQCYLEGRRKGNEVTLDLIKTFEGKIQ